MPARAWYDAAAGRSVPFGTRFACDVPPEMLELMEEEIVASAIKHDYGMTLSPSRLMSTPRKVLIEKFVDYAVDPEEEVGKFIGKCVHERLEVGLRRIGYDTERKLKGKLNLNGVEYDVNGIPDACWMNDPELLGPEDPHIVEIKTTSSGSVRFLLEDGEPKKDHVAQTSIYSHLYAQERGMNFEDVRVVIRYFCIPQKEKLMGQWIRMPASKPFPVPRNMSLDEIARHLPGYSPPTRPNHYQGPPPGSVASVAAAVTGAFERIEAGEDPANVIASFGCQCDRQYNGKGREYCPVVRDCAMLDHETPMW